MNKNKNGLNKNVFMFGVLLFSISSIVKAVPSQYCSRLSSHLRNIICDMGSHDNGELRGLDYTVSLIYEFALFSSKNPTRLKENQQLWIEKKELCQDRVCVFETDHNRIAELITIIDGHPNKPISSDNNDLKGLWFSDGGAQASYGNILIADNVIVWGGSGSATKIYCRTAYSIEKEPFGISFKDQIGGTYILNEKSQFKTYKLKLKPRKCVGNLRYLRFTLPFKIPNYANVLEYEQNNQTSGYMRFGKNY